MKRLDVEAVQAHFEEHLQGLETGAEDVIVICRDDQPIAELRAIPRRRTTRRPILQRDPRFTTPKTFFEPLPPDLVTGFEAVP